MTAPVKPVDAWGVEGPGGRLIFETVRHFQYEAKDAALERIGFRIWNRLKARGYRCVRVTVAVKEGE